MNVINICTIVGLFGNFPKWKRNADDIYFWRKKKKKRNSFSRGVACPKYQGKPVQFSTNPWKQKVCSVPWQFDQHPIIIYLPRWKSQTVYLICITSPPGGNKSDGALCLYVLLLINMWSVRGQWRRGFTRTIKTDASFYPLNGREAERVALDRAVACCWCVMTSSLQRLLRRRVNGGTDLFFFEREVGGGREGGWMGGGSPTTLSLVSFSSSSSFAPPHQSAFVCHLMNKIGWSDPEDERVWFSADLVLSWSCSKWHRTNF